jgi:hypothetical protein
LPLTDTKLRSLRPTGKRFELPDRDGLVLRVSQAGVMTWTVTLRVRGAGEEPGQRVAKLAGTKKRIGLGEYPAVSLALAREHASAMRRLARDGEDPRGCKHAPVAARTVRDLIDKFIADLCKGRRQNVPDGGVKVYQSG